ncbi:hypothetical protein BBD42_15370 [Paenibacillus sp. BIHB 4019]|uniref:Uncharacterized protein n=1 Tax=Paenibacillus sp. BIHB 4019 TaxID=1870819 RepID=A0A1B2DJ20_9BACL|nr:hypothetical protein [Paenibacillus sp. BIHB 4019]ANY67691.1 hypothetical protein BBD42_15370 [Paenibacillus sp. BIHB 4019]
MSNVKLNMLHAKYLSCSVEEKNDIFSEIYAATTKQREMNRDKIVSQGYGDHDDALTLFDNVIWDMVSDARITDFERTLNARLRKRRIDALRSNVRRRSRQRSLDTMMDDGDISDANLRSDYAIETEVLTKEADHRQVIDSIVDPSQVDTVTTLIVTAFPEYKSIAALAKALGLHHEVVKRKLHALSRRYDANRFGDYRDYLAV